MRKIESKDKIRRHKGACPKVIILSFTVVFGSLIFPAGSKGELADLLLIPEQLVPESDIALSGGHSMAWKKAWDQARYLVRTGDFPSAEKKYEELFDLRDDLEEARWEYARLLSKSGKWEKAAALLELLVECDPDRIDYLNSLALVLRELGKLSRAIDLFGRAYEKDPTDLTAMAGLAQGLVEVGRKKEAFPLFEEIFSRRPEDKSIRRSLASLAYELSKMETARKLMAPLAEREEADLDTLRMMARIHEELKEERKAAAYWKRCLKHDSGDREAHGRLALYYEKYDKSDKALPHLLALLEKDPDNASLLSRICRIYIKSDRFSKALPYFERYVTLHPNNLDVLMPVGGIKKGKGDGDIIELYRRLLAVTSDDLGLLDDLGRDFLNIGDAETALFMWEHVARLHPDRIEVYQEIVDLLERLGRDERLAEVLEVIHRLAPGEVKVVSKLAGLKVAQGEFLTGLDYYNKLGKAGYEGDDLYEGRGRLYEKLGFLSPALSDYSRLLVSQPHRSDIRRRCIVLAGNLGENIFLRKQAALLEADNDPANRDEDMMLTAGAFKEAYDFEQAETRYRFLISSRPGRYLGDKDQKKEPLTEEAKLELADLYLMEGRVFKAEQLLRKMFLAGEYLPVVVSRLFDIALYNNKRISEARIWLDLYGALGVGRLGNLFMRARFMNESDDYEHAAALLKRLIYESATGKQSDAFSNKDNDLMMRKIGLLLAEVFIETGDFDKAEQQCLAMLGGDGDQEVMILLQKIYRAAGKSEAAAGVFAKLLNGAEDSRDLLSLAKLYRDYGIVPGQIAAAGKALEVIPGSLVAASLLADARAKEGRFSDSIKLLEGMAELYPDNKSIILKIAHFYYLNGQYASSLQYCEKFLEREPDRLDAQFLKVKCIIAMDDYEYAEKIVKRLFPVGTETLLKQKVAAAGFELDREAPKRTFLQLLTFSKPETPSVAEKLMSASHLGDNSTKENRELNSIAVPLYARYLWERKFRKLLNRD